MRANLQDYDAVVADADGIAAALKTHRNIDPPLAPQPGQRAPNVRIRKAGLKYIQVYGERSSGTKYLTQLLVENVVEPDHILGSYATKSDPINKAKLIGYKHYYPRADKLAKHQHQTLFLVIYKNPYTWIRSMLGKPYHFKACLEGKGIADLAKLPLEGVDIHGREIPDLHPKTGKRITMFELRKHKILEWEKLTSLVGNVVYLNYEDLLVSPTDIMQRIVTEFPSLFRDPIARRHDPDPQYLEKYVTPKPFHPDELTTMDANIDWSVEAIAGYKKGNLFI